MFRSVPVALPFRVLLVSSTYVKFEDLRWNMTSWRNGIGTSPNSFILGSSNAACIFKAFNEDVLVMVSYVRLSYILNLTLWCWLIILRYNKAYSLKSANVNILRIDKYYVQSLLCIIYFYYLLCLYLIPTTTCYKDFWKNWFIRSGARYFVFVAISIGRIAIWYVLKTRLEIFPRLIILIILYNTVDKDSHQVLRQLFLLLVSIKKCFSSTDLWH